MRNCNPEHYDNFIKYNNKKIIACIFTLDSETPRFYEFNIDKNNSIIKECIKEYLLNKYLANHNKIYDYYEYYKKKAREEKKQSGVDYICAELDTRLPNYIKNFFHYVKREIDLCDKENRSKSNILSKISDRNIFLNELRNDLEQAIDEYIGIEDNDCERIFDY